MAFQVEVRFRSALRTRALLDELERSYEATLCFCAPDPYRGISELAESGRWPKLSIRELPGVGAPAAKAGEEER